MSFKNWVLSLFYLSGSSITFTPLELDESVLTEYQLGDSISLDIHRLNYPTVIYNNDLRDGVSLGIVPPKYDRKIRRHVISANNGISEYNLYKATVCSISSNTCKIRVELL